MALITVATPDDGSSWPDDRLNFLKTYCNVMVQGTAYPIVEATREGDHALLVIDTGEGGLELQPGDVTDVGIVQ